MGDIGSSANLTVELVVETDHGDLPDANEMIRYINSVLLSKSWKTTLGNKARVIHVSTNGDWDAEDEPTGFPDCPVCKADGDTWTDPLYVSSETINGYQCGQCSHVWEA